MPLLSNLEKIANNNIDLSEFFIYEHKHDENELKIILNRLFDELSADDKQKAVKLLIALKI